MERKDAMGWRLSAITDILTNHQQTRWEKRVHLPLEAEIQDDKMPKTIGNLLCFI